MQPVIVIEWKDGRIVQEEFNIERWQYLVALLFFNHELKAVWLKYPHHNATDQVHF